MPLARHEILLGNTFRLELPEGSGLRLDWMDAAGARQTFTGHVDGGEVSYMPAEAGTYYLATRDDADSDWCRYGVLSVVELIDATEEQLVRELANINALIADSQNELVQFQQTDPSGTAVTRIRLDGLMRLRGKVEVRLTDYRRIRQGRLPVRLS